MYGNNTIVNYYDILGVNMYATPEEIRLAYRERIKILHPDKHADPVKKKTFQEQCKLMNEAYGVLRDGAKRTQYNEILMSPSPSVSNNVHTRGAYSSVNVQERINFKAFFLCLKIFLVVVVALMITGAIRRYITKDNTIFIMAFFSTFFTGCLLVKRIKYRKMEGF